MVRKMTGNIFISYRRADSAAMAGRLYDRLNVLFPGKVFLDVDTIPPGADFLSEITDSLDKCRVLLVLIGKGWLSSSGDKSRIGDPSDYVTKEIEIAIEKKVSVIPVLMDGAVLPSDENLPTESLKGLLRFNAMEIRHVSFERDCEFLSKKLYDYLGLLPPSKLEGLLEDWAKKMGYSGFRYDEKTRAWHAMAALGLGVMATVNMLFFLVDQGPIVLEEHLDLLFATAFCIFPAFIGKNSSTKSHYAKIGLFLTLVSFLVLFYIPMYKSGGIFDKNKGDIITTGQKSVVVTGGGDANVNFGANQSNDIIISEGHSNRLIGEDGSLIVSGLKAGKARTANPWARVGEQELLSEEYRFDIAPKGIGSHVLRDQYHLKNVCEVDERLCSDTSAECEDYQELCLAHKRWCSSDKELYNHEIERIGEDPDTFCVEYDRICANDGEVCRNLSVPALPTGIYGFQIPWVIDRLDLKHTDNWSRTPLSSALLEIHNRPSGVIALVGFVTDEQAVKLTEKSLKEIIEIGLYVLPQEESNRAVSIPLERITHFVHEIESFSENSRIAIVVR